MNELIKFSANGQWKLEKGDVKLLRQYHFTPAKQDDYSHTYNFFRLGKNGLPHHEPTGQVSVNRNGNIYPITPSLSPEEYDNFFGDYGEDGGDGPDNAQLYREVKQYHEQALSAKSPNDIGQARAVKQTTMNPPTPVKGVAPKLSIAPVSKE